MSHSEFLRWAPVGRVFVEITNTTNSNYLGRGSAPENL